MIDRRTIAGMNFHYAHYPFDYFLESMKSLGIEKIEIWGASPHLYVNDLQMTQINVIKKKIKEQGLEVICFTPEQCVYPVNIAAQEDYIRERSIKYFEKSLQVCHQLEVAMLLITPGWGYLSQPVEEAWSRSRDALAGLAGQAGKLGICLALEPLTPQESNLITELSSLKRMLSEINSPYLKGMLDTIPMAMAGEDIENYLRELGQDLIHIHFIDGKPKGHLAWGDGILPLQDYLEKLRRYDYQGYLSLEITDRSYFIEPAQAVKQCLEQILKS